MRHARTDTGQPVWAADPRDRDWNLEPLRTCDVCLRSEIEADNIEQQLDGDWLCWDCQRNGYYRRRSQDTRVDVLCVSLYAVLGAGLSASLVSWFTPRWLTSLAGLLGGLAGLVVYLGCWASGQTDTEDLEADWGIESDLNEDNHGRPG